MKKRLIIQMAKQILNNQVIIMKVLCQMTGVEEFKKEIGSDILSTGEVLRKASAEEDNLNL